MNHYIDILIKPDAEMRKNVLLNKVYTKLQKALFTLNSTGIGVSFPQYKVMLGNRLRIHGIEEKLTELQATDWLGGSAGYCDVSPIQAIPNEVVYRTISRKQSNMTEAKLRRLIKRDSISLDEIKGYKAKMFQKWLDNPYLELDSLSNGHKHRRYIAFGEPVKSNSEGKFDFFGLSKTAAENQGNVA
ncbi:CRISPR-associated endonuclease Csy4 [Bathymodiolus japonicus methanotrophic gill symbiont]|uniref:type I-F CRISPR-associated endoribonuclease Cas6/Csy4 n=1 Tax=Bathymodiolus japonicus methanotrophic gill symbiont TaxID=113269 RepID=UPI001B418C35|nr:type I-F CRISPR-associated endoribonuclease Cas6/Csy4 [Bathymodiolus japonicus methanotrophic gill symbiont]GFO72460.1 CRISPR-associated endonuclease Csy4 [Bathymodiolus japonicus methanotrophic gill symbiont]